MAEKLKSSFANMLVVLTLISLVSAAALGFTYNQTAEKIAMVKAEKQLRAIKAVLPEFDNAPEAEKIVSSVDELVELFPATFAGQPVGTAVKTYSDNGFADRIWLMVGITSDNSISGISVLEHKETPGLGSEMSTPSFLEQFTGLKYSGSQIRVSKDGGKIDAITAATISSRGFCDAVTRAFEAVKAEEK